MCTVTYIPAGNQYFFTSSRDETDVRPVAFFPKKYKMNGQNIIFPKDPQAGGTWIAVAENGNVVVLLNGAVKAHHPQPPYRKSRGQILLDLISGESPVYRFKYADLHGIEPFTVILFEEEKLWSGSWDGTNIRLNEQDSRVPRIWSSVTLYDAAAVQNRESWFKNWLSENPNPSIADIVRFHRKGGEGDPYNDLLMNRAGRLFTNSISSIQCSPGKANFHYLDLRSGQQADQFLILKKKIPVKA